MLPALPYMGEALGISHENEPAAGGRRLHARLRPRAVVFGPLADRFGRRVPLLFGLSIASSALRRDLRAEFRSPPRSPLDAGPRRRGNPRGRDRRRPRPLRGPRHGRGHVADLHGLHGHAHHRPGVGQVLLLTGPWQSIVFMAGLATLISLWAFFRLPETLHPNTAASSRSSRLPAASASSSRTGWRCSTALPACSCSAPCSASCPRASRSSSTSSGSARSSLGRLRGHGGNDGCLVVPQFAHRQALLACAG